MPILRGGAEFCNSPHFAQSEKAVWRRGGLNEIKGTKGRGFVGEHGRPGGKVRRDVEGVGLGGFPVDSGAEITGDDLGQELGRGGRTKLEGEGVGLTGSDASCAAMLERLEVVAARRQIGDVDVLDII